VKEEIVEEDLILRKKLDDLEQALEKVNKEIKPTLMVMEKEIDLVIEEIKIDKEWIEANYDKLKETRWGFSITCQALSERLNLEIDNPYFGDFVKETADEI